MTIDVAQVVERVEAVRALIAARATRPARLVAVTKGFGLDAVEAALAAGVVDLGENYAQELLEKHAVLASAPAETSPRWHFIGHLQRNKVRTLARVVSMWHTIDSVRLGDEIARRAPGATVLVQVNLTGAEGQGGVDAGAVEPLVDALDDRGLHVAGLMTIGQVGDLEATRRHFATLRAMADALGLVECSMGMSGDLEVALDEGATIVRVGTTIFGPRPPRR